MFCRRGSGAVVSEEEEEIEAGRAADRGVDSDCVSPTVGVGHLAGAVVVGGTGEPTDDYANDTGTTSTMTGDAQTVGSLYEVTARLVSTVVQQQCRMYESASVDGRRVANALARMSYFVQPAVTSLLVNTEVRAPSSMCARCGGRYVYRPCAKLKAARVNSMFNRMCLPCFVMDRLTSYDCARLLDTIRSIGDMTFDCNCHSDTMLLALSAVLAMGGDEVRRSVFNVTLRHVLATRPNSRFARDRSMTSDWRRDTLPRIGGIDRKLGLVSSILTDHLFSCPTDRSRLIRQVLFQAGQSESWLRYAGLVGLVSDQSNLVDTIDINTVDEWVHLVLARCRMSASLLTTRDTAVSPASCPVCSRPVVSFTSFCLRMAGPPNEWQRSVHKRHMPTTRTNEDEEEDNEDDDDEQSTVREHRHPSSRRYRRGSAQKRGRNR